MAGFTIPDDVLRPFEPQRPYGQNAGDIQFGPEPDLQGKAESTPAGALTRANCAGEQETRHAIGIRCRGCVYYDHHACLDPVAQRAATTTAQAASRRQLGPTERSILGAAQRELLKGQRRTGVRDELVKHYAIHDIIKVGSWLSEMMRRPGYVGHLVFDPSLFHTCKDASQFLAAIGSKVCYATLTAACHGCMHFRFQGCSVLGRRILSPGQPILPEDVEVHIRELCSRGLLSRKQAERFLAQAEQHDPVAALSAALLATETKAPDWLGDLQHAEPDATFASGSWATPAADDTPGVRDIKSFYAGGGQGELDVSPWAPPGELDVGGLSPGAGRDG